MGNRYVIVKGNGSITIEDTLKTNTRWVGIDRVEAISMSRSDIEELYEQIGKILKKA